MKYEVIGDKSLLEEINLFKLNEDAFELQIDTELKRFELITYYDKENQTIVMKIDWDEEDHFTVKLHSKLIYEEFEIYAQETCNFTLRVYFIRKNKNMTKVELTEI